MPRITFLGAAGTVTGSKYLVEANGKRLLVDCGLFQGSRELNQRNWQRLIVEPATIDFVVLTHAHLDHTGYLPRLVENGFHGPIFANPVTQELCSLLLPDSAHLMEEDAEHAARHGYSSHKPPLPLYSQEEVVAALKQFASLPRLGECRISPEFLVRSHDAGHILGSSSLELLVTEGDKNTTILFSGDLGRYDQALMKDPEKPPPADYVLCESTYGDREHPAIPPPDAALAEVINRVAQRGGVIVVPAFAVDRTQLLIYEIRRLESSKRIPPLPIYMDSPMAIEVTDIYRRYHEDLKLGPEDLRADPFAVRTVHVMRSREQSKQINNVHTPAIIISASGMATGGRVLHHLEQRLPDPKNCVLLAGFQAEGTRGRALEEGAKSIRMFGKEVPVRAEVVNLRQFSAHAGRSELLRWLSGMPAAPRQLFLVHGEPAAAQALGSAVESQFRWNVTVPNYLQAFDLSA
ncbi:MAG TPA: MBL fold metallo-hydrolase [Candidatus Acidoferrales bacterium]|jgi:metallo-beta-lactamase family protein|nr:MBL fold metallo-hydrolase [Candidatus Acidoferrales bacterium]